jgi:hypothetical protein
VEARRPRRRPLAGLVALAIGVLALQAATAAAQRAAVRRTATLGALLAYPVFYHAQPVRVLGHVASSDPTLPQLFASEQRLVLLAGRASRAEIVSAGPDAEATLVLGTYYDLGRVQADDPRLDGLDLPALSQRILGKPWPGIGELPVIVVDAVEPPPSADRALRSLALDPERYAEESVTVIGRFRGRNLFGDLPDGPGRSRYDFVLQSADAAVWVTDLRPRGRGFELRLDSRIDTGRWLQVEGILRTDGRKTWIEGRSLKLTEEPATAVEAVPVPMPSTGPPPEVVFSAPTDGETDVTPDTTVRIQFSRDMDPSSFEGHVTVSYRPQESAERGEPGPPPIQPSMRYDEARRVLEVSFADPLARFRTLHVQLDDGAKARDGAALRPWRLTFSLGG